MKMLGNNILYENVFRLKWREKTLPPKVHIVSSLVV